jgi:phosphatidylglycerol---prolipoprotein diacylglyceryl transferase
VVFVCDEWFVFGVGMVVGVGPLVFHLYGLLIGVGILLGVWVSVKISRVKANEVWDGLWWVLAGGLLGARAYHVIDYFEYYWLHPGEIVQLSKGGLGIFGGILGGVLGLWFYAKEKKKFVKLLDVMAIGLPIGQMIGRWGNFFNQELYGKPSNLPWSIYIKPENRLIQVIDFERFQPLFLYESLWNLVGFLGLWWLVRNNKLKVGKGGVIVAYLGWYGLGRFWLEFLRIEVWQIMGINVAQAISLGLIGLTAWWFTRRT